MPEASVSRSALIEWGVAALALPGEAQSGDGHLVKPVGTGVLVAVVDGLGHGAEAATAAQAAVAALERHATESPVPLIERCHRALHGTRGAVMSLASLDMRSWTIDWCGVGNVEGVLFRRGVSAAPTREAMSTRGGVVGYRLPQLRVSTLSVSARDTLVLATDGIRSDFTAAVDLDAEPQAIADSLFARCAKGSDDALVLVVRCLEATP